MLLLLVSAPEKDAERIASALLDKRLAACVSRIPGVLSRYLWKGKIENDVEVLLLVKTRDDLLEPASRCIRENHSYEVPEILRLDVSGGNPDYLRWVDESTGPAAAEK